MGYIQTVALAAILMQAPGSRTTPAPPSPPSAPAAAPATPQTPQQGMTKEEADAAIEKLRQAVREAGENRRGPDKDMDPETQKALAEAANKFLSDPVIKNAIAEKIQEVQLPRRPEMMAAIFVPITFFGFLALALWFSHRSRQARLRAQMDTQTQLLSKFNSGTDLAAFLSSPGGQQFLAGMTTTQMNPRSRVLRHVAIGAVAATFGLGMLLAGRSTGGGVFFLSIGVGFLISAAASYNLAQKMGLMNGNGKPPAVPPPPAPPPL